MRAIVVIWFLVPWAIQVALLGILIRRRLYRKGMFPFFFSYTLFSVIVTIPRLALVRRPIEYAILYWSSEVIYGVLAILSLNEVFSRIFRLDYQEHPWLRFALPSMVMLIITALFVRSSVVYKTPTGARLGLLMTGLRSFDLGVHSVEGILLVLFLLLWWALVPGWNRQDYGVLLGFGISAAVTMSARIARFYFGTSYEMWYRYAPGIGYVLAAAIWLHAFWQAYEPEPRPLMRFRAMLEQVGRDNETIKLIHDWLNRRR
jgi:hypothetical protein